MAIDRCTVLDERVMLVGEIKGKYRVMKEFGGENIKIFPKKRNGQMKVIRLRGAKDSSTQIFHGNFPQGRNFPQISQSIPVTKLKYLQDAQCLCQKLLECSFILRKNLLVANKSK